MRILALLLLMFFNSPALGQWVEVRSRGSSDSTYVGSGIVLGKHENHVVAVCSGHQFRDWDGGSVVAGGQRYSVMRKYLDPSKGQDLAILKSVDPHPERLQTDVLGNNPTNRTMVWAERNGIRKEGWWSQTSQNGNSTVHHINQNGNYRVDIPGIEPGWSGGPVYESSGLLIGMVITSDLKTFATMVPVNDIRATLDRDLPGMVYAVRTRTIYAIVKKGCGPCEMFKSHYSQGLLSSVPGTFRVVEANSPAFREVTLMARSEGVSLPQVYPVFWSPGCHCSPLVDYRGVPWLLSWLPPPLTPPHDPARFQRYTRQTLANQPATISDIPKDSPPESPIDDREDVDARLLLQLRELQQQDTASLVRALEESQQNTEARLGGTDVRLSRLTEGVAALTEKGGVLSILTEKVRQLGLDATKAQGLLTDAKDAAVTAQYGAILGPAGMAGLGAVSFLWNRWRRRKDNSGTVPIHDRGTPTPEVWGTPPHSNQVPVAVPVETRPPDARIIHSTTFTPVPVDRTQEAYAWARDQMGRKYPGSIDNLELLDSMVQQYLNSLKESS